MRSICCFILFFHGLAFAQFVPIGIWNGTAIEISIDDITVTEGSDLQFTVTLSRDAKAPLNINYTTADGSAVAGVDYTSASGTATINPGNTSTTITVSSLNPASLCQPDKTFTVTLSNPTYGELVDESGTGTIQDDDVPTIDLADGTDVTEGANANLTLSLSAACSTKNVSVEVSTVNGTANGGQDFTALSSQVFTITSGNTSTNVTIATLDDALDEDDSQNFTVTLASPTNGVIGDGTGSQNILDNDDPPNISVANTSAVEGELAAVVISLDTISERVISFDVTSSDNTATTAAGDYTGVTNSPATISAGSLSTTFNLTTLDDASQCETREDFNVALSSIVNANFSNPGDIQGVVEIIEDDIPTMSITADQQSVFEGNSQTFTFTLSGTCPVDLDFDYSTRSNSATQDLDFNSISGSLTIIAGNLSPASTVTVTTNDDSDPEINEEYLLVATNIHEDQGSPSFYYAEILDNEISDNSVQSIAATDSLTCAVYDGGKSKCWGRNFRGRLGIEEGTILGDDADERGDDLPIIDLGSGFIATQVAISDASSCALNSTGQIKCWGTQGTIGYGANGNRGDDFNEMGDNLPSVDLGTGLTATKIVSGNNFFCALLNNQQVKCWGRNYEAQLGIPALGYWGDGNNEMGDNLPFVDLGAGRTVKDVDSGLASSCAILDNDLVKCWGSNDRGQLGYGHTDRLGDNINEMGDNLPYVDLGTGRTAKKIFVGHNAVCAILDNDRLKCWGSGDVNAVGDGQTYGDEPDEMGDNLPYANLGSDDFGAAWTVKDVSLSERMGCAVLSNDRVKCWGTTGNGSLGSETNNSFGTTPANSGNNIPFVDLGTVGIDFVTVKDVEVHIESACVHTSDDRMKCWGKNSNTELLPASYGLSVGNDSGEMGDNLPYFDLGSSRSLIALGSDRAAHNYSDNRNCFIITGGQVSCLGNTMDFGDSTGMMGRDHQFRYGDEPGEIETLPYIDWGTGIGVRKIVAHEEVVCALTDQYQLRCIGYSTNDALGANPTNLFGRGLGDSPGELGDNLLDIDFGIGRTVKDFTVSGPWAAPFGCAILDNQETHCWGATASSMSTPQGLAINWGRNRKAVKLSGQCALLDNGTVKCWGDGGSGRTGQGNTTYIGSPSQMGDALSPIDFGTTNPVIDIASNTEANCALFSDYQVKCWGSGFRGRLASGSTDDIGDTPGELAAQPFAAIDSTRTVKRLFSTLKYGARAFCAIMSDDSMKCWGESNSGSFGYGDGAQSFVGDQPGELSALGSALLGTGFAVREIAVALGHVCALSQEGQIKCFGDGSTGALGNGSEANNQTTAELGDNLASSYVELCQGETGVVDTTFGSSGFTQLDHGNGFNGGQYVSRVFYPDSQGRLYVGLSTFNGTYNELALARLDSEGNLDTAFGTSGFQTHDIGDNSTVQGIQVYNDEIYLSVSGASARLAKFDLDGNFVTAFGSNGVAANTTPQTIVDGLSINQNGVILQSGHYNTGGAPNDNDRSATRFDPTTGAVVSTYGTNGHMTSNLVDDEFGYTVDWTNDGSQYYYTSERWSSGWKQSVIKQNASDGSYVTSFGASGELLIDVGVSSRGRKLDIDLDGNIFVQGTNDGVNDTLYITKADSDGNIDNNWGSNGTVALTPGGITLGALKVEFIVNDIFILFSVDSTPKRLGMAKLFQDGSVDTSWGSGGYKYVTWPSSIDATPMNMTLDSKNRAIIGFHISDPSNGTDRGFTRVCLDENASGSPLAIYVDDVTVREGNVAVLTIRANKVLTSSLTVDFTTTNNTATAGTHYTTASGTATIPAGHYKTTVNVSTIDDTACGPDTEFYFDISNASDGTIEDNRAATTIEEYICP